MYLSLQEVVRPTRLEACLEALVADDTAILAGGTWLNATCPPGLNCLVDLQALPLRAIHQVGEDWRIGALVRVSGLLDGDLPAGLNALLDAARDERNLPIRNQSTVGGRVARRRADARLPTALLALDATLEIAALGNGGARVARVPIAALPGLQLGGAIITAIRVPSTTLLSGYRSFSLTAVDVPVTDVALARTPDGWRLASGGHGDDSAGNWLLDDAAGVLDDAGSDDNWRTRLREAVVDGLPAHDCARASGDYRRAVAATLAVRLAGDLLGGADAGSEGGAS